MPRLPRVSGEQTIRALERHGFVRVRQKGSHVVLRKRTSKGDVGCVVPLHTGIGRWHSKWHFETGEGLAGGIPENTIAMRPSARKIRQEAGARTSRNKLCAGSLDTLAISQSCR